MNIPEDLRYTRDHEWILVEDGIVIVGITDFAQNELGDIVYVEFPTVGSSVKASETFGNVESVKSVSDLFSPVTGVVADINTRLSDSPELVNTDPYGEGWMIRVEPGDAAELEQLLGPEEYSDYIGAETE